MSCWLRLPGKVTWREFLFMMKTLTFSIEDNLTADNYESHAEDGHNDEESHKSELKIWRIFPLNSHLIVIIVRTELES